MRGAAANPAHDLLACRLLCNGMSGAAGVDLGICRGGLCNGQLLHEHAGLLLCLLPLSCHPHPSTL